MDNTEPGRGEIIGRDKAFKERIPVLTLLASIVCIVIFAGINLGRGQNGVDTYPMWGAPSYFDIFNGSYWALITSSFVHVRVWHIAFNLYWFWRLGKIVEFEQGKIFFLLFILSAGCVSELSQLSFADNSGIGLSGIVYALFGYIFLSSTSIDAYRYVINKQVVQMFLAWLVFCIILTRAGIWNVGNAAHIGGLVWGFLVAWLSRFGYMTQLSGGLAALALLASSITWNPFGTTWLTFKGYNLMKNGHTKEALSTYKKVIARDHNNIYASDYIRILEMQVLCEQAYKLHERKKYSEARQVYIHILAIDSTNQWAKENLSRLPAADPQL